MLGTDGTQSLSPPLFGYGSETVVLVAFDGGVGLGEVLGHTLWQGLKAALNGGGVEGLGAEKVKERLARGGIDQRDSGTDGGGVERAVAAGEAV